jgi:CRP/FNR family transcriptional regulator
MAPSPAYAAISKVSEDPLDYLPCSKTLEYKKGEAIYGPAHPCDTLYLVLAGIVKLTRFGNPEKEFLVDLYTTDDIFGGAGILNVPDTAEEVVCFQRCRLMAWPVADVEDLILRRPRLGVALLQVFGRRMTALMQRAESLSFEPIDIRLARSLIHFSEHLGAAQSDGSVIMEPLTHELLAQYVGTSRELISVEMASLRRRGYITYSRKAIVLYRDALKACLNDRLPVQ